jgi:hypothetical protein
MQFRILFVIVADALNHCYMTRYSVSDIHDGSSVDFLVKVRVTLGTA